MNPFLTNSKKSDDRNVQQTHVYKHGRRSYLSVGIGGDSQSTLEREPLRSKDRGLLSIDIVIVIVITRRVPVQRAVERDEIPYPYKVHDTTLRPLLNITIKSTIVVRSRSRSCGNGDICGTTPA